MTREAYAWVAKITGVPVDTPKRELKVARDKIEVPALGLAEEFEFFAETLPHSKGPPIHPGKTCVAIEIAKDASDTAWFGFMNVGLGGADARPRRPEARRGLGVQLTTREECSGTSGTSSPSRRR